jgi:hypothetical protein
MDQVLRTGAVLPGWRIPRLFRILLSGSPSRLWSALQALTTAVPWPAGEAYHAGNRSYS